MCRINFLKDWKSGGVLKLSSTKFHILGPKYLMDLESYDVVFILGKDKILDPLSW